MDTDDFIQIYEGTKKNKKPTKRKLVFDDKKEKVSKFDLQRFNALVDELDNAIKKCFREFYEQFLSSFDLFFKSVPSKGKIPALYLSGCFIDVELAIQCMKERCTKCLTVEEWESMNYAKEEREKNVIFFDLSTSHRELALFIPKLIKRDGISVVFYQGNSLCVGQTGIDRSTFACLEIAYSNIPPSTEFLQMFFNQFVPMGILDDHLCFDGDILHKISTYFRQESYSIPQLRKFLVFAIHNYCSHRIAPRKNSEKISTKFQYLGLIKLLADLSENSDKTKQAFVANCMIQSLDNTEAFSQYFRKLQDGWKDWTRTIWIQKLDLIDSFKSNNRDLFDKQMDAEFTRLKSEITKHNPEPTTSSAAPNTRKSKSNTAKFFSSQEMRRKQISSVNLSQIDLNRLHAFLHSFFTKNLHKFEDKNLASVDICERPILFPNDLSTCSITRQSFKCDTDLNLLTQCLFEMEKNFGNNIPLINLFDLFYSMQPNIEKIETTSRFYNAMAHLEFIGIVKFISENLIRFTDFLLLRELVTDK